MRCRDILISMLVDAPSVKLGWWHRQDTSAGQGGHGPGWHSSMHAWPQAGSSGLPQVAPQECGAAQGSKGGSTTLPQKQRYSLGASAAV